MPKLSSLALIAGASCISQLVSTWQISPNGTALAGPTSSLHYRAAGPSKTLAEARFEWISTNPYDSSEAVARQPVEGLWRSTDGRKSWTALPLPEGSSGARLVFALPSQTKLKPTPPSVMYLYSDRVWRSEDSGQTWSLIYSAGNSAKVTSLASFDTLPGSAMLMLSDGRVLTTLDATTATSGFGWLALLLPNLKEQEGKALACASREYCYAAFAGNQDTRIFRILIAIGRFDEVALPAELRSLSSTIRLEVCPESPEEITLEAGATLWSSHRNAETATLEWKRNFDSESDLEEAHSEIDSDHAATAGCRVS